MSRACGPSGADSATPPAARPLEARAFASGPRAPVQPGPDGLLGPPPASLTVHAVKQPVLLLRPVFVLFQCTEGDSSGTFKNQRSITLQENTAT